MVRLLKFESFLNESSNSVIDLVKDLAIRLHGDQIRKYSGDPYYTHLFRVSDTVKEIGGDEAMIMAALLHDVLEDTPTNDIELISELEMIVDPQMARDIVNLVIELTDVYIKENFPEMNRKARKEMEAKRLGEVSSRAQTIKYADLLDNGEDIMKNDPSFGRVYLREKERILNYMRNGDKYLYNKCLSQIS
jgi:(p)ppGpp synthase/HD superfamily hydrolase